ncbi:unnamed protein product [Colias eurytheme]|nr:unnamed protein product [Colias eurytheme]
MFGIIVVIAVLVTPVQTKTLRAVEDEPRPMSEALEAVGDEPTPLSDEEFAEIKNNKFLGEKHAFNITGKKIVMDSNVFKSCIFNQYAGTSILVFDKSRNIGLSAYEPYQIYTRCEVWIKN